MLIKSYQECKGLRGKGVAGVDIPEGSTHSFRRAWGTGVGRDSPDRDLIRERNKRPKRGGEGGRFLLCLNKIQLVGRLAAQLR